MIIRKEVHLITPYQLPLILGNEFSGIVEQTGENVKEFKPGDRVYCRMPLNNIGAFAEYAVVNKNSLAHIPDNLSFEEAACVPLTALTAIQAFELMNTTEGESIFISGGTGSLGAMAIPLAKNYGLKVITSGSQSNKERVESLGVDLFIDYKTEDYENILSDVDYVLDTIGESELEKEFKILKKGGTLVSLKGLPNHEFAKRMKMPLHKKLLFKLAGHKYDNMAKKKQQKYYFLFVESDGQQLEKISEIIESDKIEVSIDSIYELNDVNEALNKVKKGGSKGKTLIKI